MSEFFLELFSEENPSSLQKILREKILDDFNVATCGDRSKLLNYFIDKKDVSKMEKETDDILKSILKDKKYIITTNDEDDSFDNYCNAACCNCSNQYKCGKYTKTQESTMQQTC